MRVTETIYKCSRHATMPDRVDFPEQIAFPPVAGLAFLFFRARSLWRSPQQPQATVLCLLLWLINPGRGSSLRRWFWKISSPGVTSKQSALFIRYVHTLTCFLFEHILIDVEFLYSCRTEWQWKIEYHRCSAVRVRKEVRLLCCFRTRPSPSICFF
jgi:hypothetical protein